MAPPALTTLPWTPDHLVGAPDAPVFLIRPGTMTERVTFEAMLAAPPYRAGRVFPWVLADTAIAAARSLLDGEQLGQVIDAFTALKKLDGVAGLPIDQRQLVIGIEGALTAAWPEYAELHAQLQRRLEIMPLLACRQFLVGWDRFDAEFVTDKDGRPTDDTLRAMGPFFMPLCGHQAYNLLYAKDQFPLSPPPSNAGPAPVISPAAKPIPMAGAGKSTAPSGKKTRR